MAYVPLKTNRDLRDETWMIREGLAEYEREQVLKNQCGVEAKRYQLSTIPYLGTDVKLTAADFPRPRAIYEDDSEYTRLCKRGGHKDLLWSHPDYPLEPVPEQPEQYMRPKQPQWAMHLSSLLPSAYEEFQRNRKLPPTTYPKILERQPRLDPMKLPAALGAPREYTWEAGLRRDRPDMYKLVTNGYVEPFLMESRKLNYFESLFDRPQTEDEKLQVQLFEDQRSHNNVLRETARRFDRMARGLPSWTILEREKAVNYLFPNGVGHGCRPPPLLPKTKKKKGRRDPI